VSENKTMSKLFWNALKLVPLLLGATLLLARTEATSSSLAAEVPIKAKVALHQNSVGITPKLVADKPDATNQASSSLEQIDQYNQAPTANLTNSTLGKIDQYAQATTAPSAQVTSVSQLSNVQPAALNATDTPTPKASVQKPNAQQMPKEGVKGTAAALLAQTASEPKPKASPLSSYTGIGGDIGLTGHRSALGSGGLAILGKTRLTDNLSLHTATVVFGSRTATSTYALTFGTAIKNKLTGQVIAFPFLGGGVALRNINGLRAAPLISSGVDVPIARRFTATARLNVGFFPDGRTDVGLLIGVGYNFSLFSLFR
jgi:hypothetical protein